MSLSSTSSATGPRPARVATVIAVALAVLAPLAVLCAQIWVSTGDGLAFTRDERRGAAYLEPLTELLAATTQAQSAAVRGTAVDQGAVRAAMRRVDEADGRLGDRLGSSDRWRDVRPTIEDRIGRRWGTPAEAFTQYSDLNTTLLELNRAVGDNSRLILDPDIDAYYVMNAAVLRIPEILVDAGRYADLSVLGDTDAGGQGQLAAARNQVAIDAADLSDGLVKAFGRTDSSTLGPGLTRQLDNFRTAVDAVAPSNSLLVPPPAKNPTQLGIDQQALVRTALDLQRASLTQLDRLLADRAGGDQRNRVIAGLATGFGVLVTVGAAYLALRRRPTPAPEELPAPVLERVGGARAAR
jgi:hypothetical protein